MYRKIPLANVYPLRIKEKKEEERNDNHEPFLYLIHSYLILFVISAWFLITKNNKIVYKKKNGECDFHIPKKILIVQTRKKLVNNERRNGWYVYISWDLKKLNKPTDFN